MKHYSLTEWQDYINGNLLDDEVRNEYEQHLYSCDDCLESYMSAIESLETDLPTITEPSLYTDELMKKIPFKEADKTIYRRKWYEDKVFHYLLATAMTFLLMLTGVFSELTNVSSKFEQKTQPSFTEQVLTFLDKVEKIEEKEKK
ncbi:hypothetical protein WAK64_11230 [Bacillus spongiae]|uniref:Zinc-finger domain-containing protein n=1 Tax=Bacillus spongiae TaxID=2683610 RepID=A0ABU8HEZ9_9BACI